MSCFPVNHEEHSNCSAFLLVLSIVTIFIFNFSYASSCLVSIPPCPSHLCKIFQNNGVVYKNGGKIPNARQRKLQSSACWKHRIAYPQITFLASSMTALLNYTPGILSSCLLAISQTSRDISYFFIAVFFFYISAVSSFFLIKCIG